MLLRSEYKRLRADLYIRQMTTTMTTSSNHAITNTKPSSTKVTLGNNFIRTNDTTTTTSTSSSSSSSIHRNDLCGGSGVGMSGYSWIQSNPNFKSMTSHSQKSPPCPKAIMTRQKQTVKKKKTRKQTTVLPKKLTRVTSSSISQSRNPIENYNNTVKTNMTTIASNKTTTTTATTLSSSFKSRNQYHGTYTTRQQQQRRHRTSNIQHTSNNTIYNSVQRKDTELQHVGGANIAF
jgi:hypothetical protein